MSLIGIFLKCVSILRFTKIYIINKITLLEYYNTFSTYPAYQFSPHYGEAFFQQNIMSRPISEKIEKLKLIFKNWFKNATSDIFASTLTFKTISEVITTFGMMRLWIFWWWDDGRPAADSWSWAAFDWAESGRVA